MKTLPLILDTPPELSDEAATQCLDFLCELTVSSRSTMPISVVNAPAARSTA